MGKAFGRELEILPETVKWAKKLDLGNLEALIGKYRHPVLIVGSGGSFSACVYAADLLIANGIFAKAVSPLELIFSRSTIRSSNLIFISASGNNTDILFSFKKAIENEPISIISICMRKKSKLATLSSQFSSCTSFEFDIPSGKDGFLATNSLAAFFVILFRGITGQSLIGNHLVINKTKFSRFLKQINESTCFTLLYGSFQHSIAIDLESKFSEAGLAPSLLSDYRHFAHGRHQWFDKKKNSAIIALSSPSDDKLCKKTLALLPSSIPKLILYTNLDSFEGAIELLFQSMQLINYYGKKVGLDPGRPGVPEYGSKIYNLKYERLIASSPLKTIDAAIIRKSKVNRISDLNKVAYNIWKNHYNKSMQKLKTAKFGSMVFDYDGTLCSPANRFKGISEEIKKLLVNFVQKGFVLGVISGRGKSLRTDLEKVFAGNPKLMKNVIIGYYNGSDIASLENKSHPIKTGLMHPSLQTLFEHLNNKGISSDNNPNQLTFGSKTTQEWGTLRDVLLNEMMLLNLSDITIVESSHSIDIIPRKIASKNHIISHCKILCESLKLSSEALCIGDRGQWPGNDYELLANKYALSVGEVSSDPETGWNICPPGLKDEKATEYLFQHLQYKKGFFIFNQL